QRGGPLGALRGNREAYQVPAVPLSQLLKDTRVLAFLVVWFGLSLLFGMGTFAMPGIEENVAWEAHIGGFLAGPFGFGAFAQVATPIEGHETTAGDTEIIRENDML